MANVIFDLDGTLALTEHRQNLVPKNGKGNWDDFFRACVCDEPNHSVINILGSLRSVNHEVYILSGRSDLVRKETEAWLWKHVVVYDKLIMRKQGDYTPDDKLKWAMANTHGLTPKNTLAVFDDRNKVVKMWREKGFTCCQVAEGDF